MPIGVFDSGVGGLTIHRALTKRLVAADFVYLADQAHVPYGIRTGEDIVRLTQAGCERLFREGCDLIVLACNTASAVALRRLQQSWLPGFRQALGRPANVLGIIVPTIEVATGRPWDERRGDDSQGGGCPGNDPKAAVRQMPGSREILGLFATPATARSQVYDIEIAKRRRDIRVVTEPCPELAGLIEQGAETQELARVIQSHVDGLMARIGGPPDKVVLGSTHYEVVADVFRRALPAGVDLIQQPRATADALEAYLAKHPEFRPGKNGLRRFLTTGRPGTQHALVETFWGEPLTFEAVSGL